MDLENLEPLPEYQDADMNLVFDALLVNRGLSEYPYTPSEASTGWLTTMRILEEDRGYSRADFTNLVLRARVSLNLILELENSLPEIQ